MNILTLVGRVGQDGELRTISNDKTVLNFSVATDIGFGENKSTMWVRCSIWGNRAQAIAPYILKGTQVTVSGPCKLRSWENAEKSGTDLELDARDVALHSVPDREPAAQAAPPANQVVPEGTPEIPF